MWTFYLYLRYKTKLQQTMVLCCFFQAFLLITEGFPSSNHSWIQRKQLSTRWNNLNAKTTWKKGKRRHYKCSPPQVLGLDAALTTVWSHLHQQQRHQAKPTGALPVQRRGKTVWEFQTASEMLISSVLPLIGRVFSEHRKSVCIQNKEALQW